MEEAASSSSVGLRHKVDADWKFLDRPHGDMAIFSTPQGVVALHCRAAYERIRFEQLEDSLEGEGESAAHAPVLALRTYAFPFAAELSIQRIQLLPP